MLPRKQKGTESLILDELNVLVLQKSEPMVGQIAARRDELIVDQMLALEAPKDCTGLLEQHLAARTKSLEAETRSSHQLYFCALSLQSLVAFWTAS
jgi:hypothetical protein